MGIERRLSDVLSEFARTSVMDFPFQTILDHLVLTVVDVLPVSAAGVTLRAPGADLYHVAASDEAALRFQRLQRYLGEGPVVAVCRTGEAIAVTDLANDQRFPDFSKRAIQEGMAAVFTFPLRHGGKCLGALDLYQRSPATLDAEAMMAAQTLADVAAVYLLNAQTRAELRQLSDDARENSLHDELTGLPNRTLLVQRLEHAIQRCTRSNGVVAILFADLDLFKSINDTYGHHVGDELLMAVADRLTGLLRPGDTVARLSGDEFVILCEEIDDPRQVEPIAARVGAALSEVFVLSVANVQVSASIGIALAGRRTQQPEQILREADMAMYQAKRNGGGCHTTLDLREHHRSRNRARLNGDLRGAMVRGELRAEYQPIVSTNDGRITAVEALLRWQHPTHGTVEPATVVPLAEQIGLIVEIGRWMLERACLDRQRWRSGDGDGELEISVNVSARQLMESEFAASVARILGDTNTDPGRVTLEVTEGVFIQEGTRVVEALNDLKSLGVKLALDDFGAGYSSLSYLKRFPVDIMKIDRVFIADLDSDAPTRVIVRAVVELAHDLGMTVVAEGVESAAQYEQVASLGCDSCQGFYFARPSSAEAFDALLRQQSAVSGSALRR